MALTDHVIVEDLADFLRRRDAVARFHRGFVPLTDDVEQSSTHSSQMKTVGPAISLRASCWLLPQNEQYNVLMETD